MGAQQRCMHAASCRHTACHAGLPACRFLTHRVICAVRAAMQCHQVQRDGARGLRKARLLSVRHLAAVKPACARVRPATACVGRRTKGMAPLAGTRPLSTRALCMSTRALSMHTCARQQQHWRQVHKQRMWQTASAGRTEGPVTVLTHVASALSFRRMVDLRHAAGTGGICRWRPDACGPPCRPTMRAEWAQYMQYASQHAPKHRGRPCPTRPVHRCLRCTARARAVWHTTGYLPVSLVPVDGVVAHVKVLQLRAVLLQVVQLLHTTSGCERRATVAGACLVLQQRAHPGACMAHLLLQQLSAALPSSGNCKPAIAIHGSAKQLQLAPQQQHGHGRHLRRMRLSLPPPLSPPGAPLGCWPGPRGSAATAP